MNDTDAQLQTTVLDPATILSLMLPEQCTMHAVDIDDSAISKVPDSLIPTAAVDSRRIEFAAGRVAASNALKELTGTGHYPSIGDHREPVWPTGTIGSITHDDRHAIAVTAKTTQLSGIGIDLEKKQRMDTLIQQQILSQAEIARLHEPATASVLGSPIAAFAYKEAIFKCSFPVTHVFLDFLDVELYGEGKDIRCRCVNPTHSVAATISEIQGRVVTTDEYVIALCWLPVSSA